jgi:hypothetical protein
MPIAYRDVAMAYVRVETAKAQQEFTHLVKLIPVPTVPHTAPSSTTP